MADRDAVEANAGRPCTAIFHRFAGRRPWPDRVEMPPNTPDAVARAVVASIAKHGDAAVAAIPEEPYVIPFSRAARGHR